MQHNTLKPPETEGPLLDAALLDEATHWVPGTIAVVSMLQPTITKVDFAQGAYGKDDIKGYDKASVNVAIGEKWLSCSWHRFLLRFFFQFRSGLELRSELQIFKMQARCR